MNKRVPIAVGLVVAGTVAAVAGLAPMLDVGTCASGGPYVIANECPSSYAWLFWVMFGGIVAAIAGMIMMFVVASFPAGFAVLSAWFVLLGAGAFIGARSLDGDAQLGLDIVGWVSVPLGAGGLLLSALMHRAATREAARRPRPSHHGRR